MAVMQALLYDFDIKERGGRERYAESIKRFFGDEMNRMRYLMSFKRIRDYAGEL